MYGKTVGMSPHEIHPASPTLAIQTPPNSHYLSKIARNCSDSSESMFPNLKGFQDGFFIQALLEQVNITLIHLFQILSG